MKILNSKFEYFRRSLLFISNNTYLIMCLTIAEYLVIITYILESSLKLQHLHEKYSDSHEALITLKMMSFFYHFRKFVTVCQVNQVSKLSACSYPVSFLITVGIIIILFIVYIIVLCVLRIFQEEKRDKLNQIGKAMNIIVINFYEFGFFRAGGIIVIDICFNFFTSSSAAQSEGTRYLFLILSLLIFSSVLFIFISFLLSFRVLIKIPQTQGPIFDRMISLKFDIFSFAMKVLISWECNILALNKDVISNSVAFLNIISICLVIGFNSYITINLIFDCKTFIQNAKRNLPVVILGIFMTLSLIFSFFSQHFAFRYSHLVIFLITFFLLSIFLGLFLKDFSRKKIIYGTNLISKFQLAQYEIPLGRLSCSTLREIFFLELQDNPLNVMIKEETNDEDNDEVLSYRNLLKILKEKIKKKGKVNLPKPFNDLDFNFLFDLLKFEIKLQSKEKNIFQLHIMLKKLISKYSEMDEVMTLNLMVVYNIFVREHSGEYADKKFSLLDTTDQLTSKILEFLTSWSAFIENDFRSHQEYFKIAAEFKKFRTFSKKKLSKLKKTEDYHCFIIHVILEEIISKPIKDDIQSFFLVDVIEVYDEFLRMHFNTDRTILLKLNTKFNKIQIIRTSKELMEFNNTEFQNIFPVILRTSGLHLFNHIISRKNTNERVFKFFIQFRDGTISPFKMTFELYPSMQRDDVLIYGEFAIRYEEILITEVMEGFREKKREYIYLFSSGLADILLMPVNFISLFAKFHLKFCISDIFPKSPSASILIDIALYRNFFHQFLESCKISQSLPQEDLDALNTYQSQIIAQRKKKNIKCITLTHETDITYNRKNFIIYSVNDISTTTKKGETHLHIDETTLIEDTYFQKNLSLSKNANTRNAGNSSGNNYNQWMLHCDTGSSSISSLSQIDHKSNLVRMTDSIIKKNSSKIRFSTIIILILNSLTVTLSVVFLVYEMNDNNQFKQFVSVYSNYFGLNRHFFHSMLSLFGNFCVSEGKALPCVNRYKEYSADFSQRYKTSFNNYTKDIYTLIDLDLGLKIAELEDRIDLWKQDLYSLNMNDLSVLLTSDFEFSVFSLIGTNLSLQSAKMPFIESVQEYATILHNIYQYKEYSSLPLSKISINDEGDIDFSQVDITNLNLIHLYAYNMLINYPRYLDYLFTFSDKMTHEIFAKISQSNVTIIIFILIFVLINIIVFCLCFRVLIKFKTLIDGRITKISQSLKDPPTIEKLKEKISNINALVKFYECDPVSIMKKMHEKHKDKMRAKKENLNNKVKEEEKEKEMPEDKKLAGQKDNFYTGRFYKIVFLIFSFFAIYSGLYYLIFYFSFKALNLLFHYCEENSSYEKSIYNNLSLIQLMELTNISEQYISKLISDNGKDNSNYVQYSIHKTFWYAGEIRKLEKNNKDIFPDKNSLIDLDCSVLVKNLNDSRTYQINKAHPEFHFPDMLTDICYSFDLMKHQDDILLGEVITSDSQNILQMLKHKSINNTIVYRNLLFDTYTSMLLLYRPLRTFFNKTIFTGLVNKFTENHSSYLISYLILNFFIEIFLFFSIEIFVTRKISRLNKNMISFHNMVI